MIHVVYITTTLISIKGTDFFFRNCLNRFFYISPFLTSIVENKKDSIARIKSNYRVSLNNCFQSRDIITTNSSKLILTYWAFLFYKKNPSVKLTTEVGCFYPK